MAAPKGNQNAAKAKVFSEAIRRALIGDKTRIDRLAQALLDKAESGDLMAIREVADRLEGKPAQVIAGDPDQPLIERIERVIVRPNADAED